MLDILKIIEEKIADKRCVAVTAETPQGCRIEFKVIFDAVLSDNKAYMLLHPLRAFADCKETDEIVYRRTRVNKVMSLIPATDAEINHLLEFYHSQQGEDFIELLDENGEKTGQKYVRKRGKSIAVNGMYFAVVEVWVRFEGDKLLLIQRHPDKDFAMQWECPGGTVRFSETPLKAVRRELFEETWILIPYERFTYLGVTKRNNWFCHSYLLDIDNADSEIKLQSEECFDYKFVDIDKMDGFICELTEGHKETFLKYKDRIASVNK